MEQEFKQDLRASNTKPVIKGLPINKDTHVQNHVYGRSWSRTHDTYIINQHDLKNFVQLPYINLLLRMVREGKIGRQHVPELLNADQSVIQLLGDQLVIGDVVRSEPSIRRSVLGSGQQQRHHGASTGGGGGKPRRQHRASAASTGGASTLRSADLVKDLCQLSKRQGWKWEASRKYYYLLCKISQADKMTRQLNQKRNPQLFPNQFYTDHGYRVCDNTYIFYKP